MPKIIFFLLMLCILPGSVFAQKGAMAKKAAQAAKKSYVAPRTSVRPLSGFSTNIARKITTLSTQTSRTGIPAAVQNSSVTSPNLQKNAPKLVTPTPLPTTEVGAAALPAIQDTGTNLTGMQVLATYFPTWRQELGAMFSKEQLDAVEKAFADTDEWMFVQGEDGELTVRNQDEWNYEERFLTILQDSGVSFTDKQIKQLIGTKGMRGFTFKIYFFRMKAVGFSCAKGIKPHAQIYRDNHQLKYEEMTPEEIQEVTVGTGLASYRKHPAVIAYMQKNRLRTENKTAEEYVALAQQYPTKPRSDIYRGGRKLTREEMTPEEIQEVYVGKGLDTHRKHPAVIAYNQKNRLKAEAKTAEEYVALAKQYSTKPRSHIYRDGRELKREEMTPEEIQEVIIGLGLAHNANHPAVVAYMQRNRVRAENKTAEEYVALARQYPTKPRADISKNGRRLSRAEMTPEEIQEVNVGKGLATYRKHPAVIAYMQKNRLQTEAQTTEQLYAALMNHIKDYGRYPSHRESSLYINIYNRLRRHQSTMVEGKYTDPWLQKIYELKTAVQNAPEGEFTLTPDGKGGYILEIEEPTLEEDEISTPQPVEEVAPVAPSPHTIRLRINEQTKNLIESVRDAAALERRQFPGWLRSMHEPENFPQIVDANTFNALHVLNRAINFDYRNGQNRRAVTYLLQNVNNYVGALGEQPELGAFYKLIYRGKVDDTMLPIADNFHIVAEEQGLSWDGALAPQVDKVNRLLIQADKQNTPFSVYFDGDEEMITTIRTASNASAKMIHEDLSAILKILLPPGYKVRMGLHEIGISGQDLSKFRRGYLHLHLEHASVPDGDMEGLLIDHSISLDVDVRRFAGRRNIRTKSYEPLWDKDIAKNYLELFDSFLSDEARQALQKLAQ